MSESQRSWSLQDAEERESIRGTIGELAELPSSYARWRASLLGRATDALEQDLILRLIGAVTGLRVLDVGCGDGQLAALLARAGASVAAIDSDPGMLKAAGRRFAAAGLSVALDRGSIEALPYDDDIFDIVLAVTVLCLVDDPREAVAQMARVLKPGGRLFLGELGRRSLWAAWRRFRGRLGHATWRSARFFTQADLRDIVEGSGLAVQATRGAIFYPPLGWAATALAPVDPWFGQRFVSCGAFLALVATKVDAP
jgi:ubiquinone/menaquinone biosynthesis C-methylase UbiE